MKRYVLKICGNKSDIIEEYQELTEARGAFQEALSKKRTITTIVLLDRQKTLVDCIALFKEDKICFILKNNDIVKLKTEFCGAGEAGYLYKVTNINENNRRCLITCINGGGFIPVSETVDIEMLDSAKHKNII